MKKTTIWRSMTIVLLSMVLTPMTVFAGWQREGDSWRYQQDDGSFAVSQWVNDGGVFYYLNESGMMARNTTTPDGYLVAEDGSWVTDMQSQGGYVRTPYDNSPYFIDPYSQIYIFDEGTDYAWVSDTKVLAAVRGIIQAEDLSEQNQAVYREVCEFLTGFDYSADEYTKAKRVYEEITGRAVYNEGDYVIADDEVYSVLVDGRAKCIGFARTYKLLANAVGLKCGIRENGAHMWNAVYIDGVATHIDASTVGTSPEFYLDVKKDFCPACGYENLFGNREISRPCGKCGIIVENPKYQ